MATDSGFMSSNGVVLAVHRYTEIDAARPTILAIHGWPDNHHVWDPVAEEFARNYPGRYNVVAYDVRGSGESSTPAKRSGYEFAQLIADLGAVIEQLGVERVHLLAHDWGSLQAWAAITDESVMGRVASLTSISGPHLQYAGAFLRSARTPRALARVAGQLLGSTYIGLFLCPGLPEVVFRSRVGVKVVEAIERIGRSSTRSQRRTTPRSMGDYVNGLNLYRANMPAPMLRPGRELPKTDVPVQVLVPRKDLFVTPALQRFTGAIPPDSRVVSIEGGHWVVTSRPDVIARLTSEWIDRDTGVVTGLGAPGEIAGKLALITGAGAGIGRATAVELARHGARKVIVVDRDVLAANDTADAVRAACAEAAVYQADVSDEEKMNTLAAQVLNDHGVVDILVNNAGIGMAGRFLQTSPQNWEDIIGVNLRGVIAGSRAFGAQMVERGAGGTIINVSSASAYLPSKSMIAYSTTKAAVLAFSESLRADFADEGITVTAVCPGFVNTDIAKNTIYAGTSDDEQERARTKAAAGYRRRNYTPEATAAAIVKAIKTGPAVAPIAAEARIGYAMRRISPSLIRLLARVDIRPK
ncbi:SDR family oxidoreductase [Mycobacterium sherrisii]|uniref:SDR family oxidoreductase n=1 Tax=Mycobacterium sherrisii TaxID=243061 RepID=UPI000A154681|nr:SDR family oxidoreductase [Mycobacterium sherrisii]MCV7028823.1 SDR family oxidoreductase [Mycobacterium sherrisii]ORW82637.1 short-chain dehydrogenase [Mycobacterium sherrisii]